MSDIDKENYFNLTFFLISIGPPFVCFVIPILTDHKFGVMNYEPERELLDRYFRGECTQLEKAAVENWYLSTKRPLVDLDFNNHDRLKKMSWNTFRKSKSYINLKWIHRLAAAAALVGVLVTVYFFEYNPKKKIEIKLAQEILPGTDKAILSLANGKKINLSSVSSGALMSLNGTQIIKSAGGEIVFKIVDSEIINKIHGGERNMNSITTPRGGQYTITLPDGTRVKLNAGSSLHFPTSFTGLSNRRVSMTGEAYFEVAKNNKQPFIVDSGNQLIEVIGTHFNINAYLDEKTVSTTLLEGSVKISDKTRINQVHDTRILQPGEQARYSGGKISVNNVNTEAVIAWKNGEFEFHYDDIQTLLRQFSRWYNIDVKYSGIIPSFKFSGRIHRNQPLSTALEILAFSNVKFKVEGRTLLILNDH